MPYCYAVFFLPGFVLLFRRVSFCFVTILTRSSSDIGPLSLEFDLPIFLLVSLLTRRPVSFSRIFCFSSSVCGFLFIPICAEDIFLFVSSEQGFVETPFLDNDILFRLSKDSEGFKTPFVSFEINFQLVEVSYLDASTAEDHFRIGCGFCKDRTPFFCKSLGVVAAHPVHMIQQDEFRKLFIA